MMQQEGTSILYGHPFLSIKDIQGDLKEMGDLTLRQQMWALRLTLSKINDWVWERLPVSNSDAPL
jgi:hypothetical protein